MGSGRLAAGFHFPCDFARDAIAQRFAGGSAFFDGGMKIGEFGCHVESSGRTADVLRLSGQLLSASPPFSSIVARKQTSILDGGVTVLQCRLKDELRQLLEEHERVVADFPKDGTDRRADEDVA